MNNQSNFNLPFTNIIEDQITFQNPWHGQVFAITVQLSENGNFFMDRVCRSFWKFS